MNATATADVGPLVWRRVRAGLYEADAGRFGLFVVERVDGRWWASSPRAVALEGRSTLKAAKVRAGRWLALAVAKDPRTLLEWGVTLLCREYGADAGGLYEWVVCCPVHPLWVVAAGCVYTDVPGGGTPAGLLLALRRVWETAARSDQTAAIARDCIADPSLLGVLADAAQDAGNPTLEEAARSVAAAIESLRARKEG